MKLMRWFLIGVATTIVFTLGYKAAMLLAASNHFISFDPYRLHAAFGLGMMIFIFVFKMAFILIGWRMWKKCKGVGKVLGAILFTCSIWSLLPSILAIPILLVTMYIVFKMKKHNQVSRVTDSYIHSNNHADILDRWEKTVR